MNIPLIPPFFALASLAGKGDFCIHNLKIELIFLHTVTPNPHFSPFILYSNFSWVIVSESSLSSINEGSSKRSSADIF